MAEIIETTPTTNETGNPVRRGTRDIIYLSAEEEEDDQTEPGEAENDPDVMETEEDDEDDDEAEYLKTRAKQPRLDPAVKEDAKKQSEEAPVEEEVGV